MPRITTLYRVDDPPSGFYANVARHMHGLELVLVFVSEDIPPYLALQNLFRGTVIRNVTPPRRLNTALFYTAWRGDGTRITRDVGLIDLRLATTITFVPTAFGRTVGGNVAALVRTDRRHVLDVAARRGVHIRMASSTTTAREAKIHRLDRIPGY